ncbi:SDR family NAD(P)-dependent oxidoreductase [Nocardia jiangxiensis]|uniref:SDR family NAD(P)-dependent oxidoreductase n=1 Tax=Nocardia jiangxiensis TaxID=282685 RepID=A0ABW6RRJ7_9NOCA|nr:SDR family NAD(P)-dependent oxidoreductase [Nocardia jiangxiensis]
MDETPVTHRERSLPQRVAIRLFYPTFRPSEKALRAAVADKTVLVTGASHGIGKASARRLAAAGAVVLLVARSGPELEQLAADITGDGGTARAYPTDLADMAAVDRLGRTLLAEYGHIDMVISNAGKSIRRPIAESYDRFHDFTRTIDVNYLGPVRLLLTLLPQMCARKQGHIVNVSTWGVLMPPSPRWSAYGASKAAFDVWLRSIAAEIAGDHVTTTSVYMPLVHTRMSAPTDFRHIAALTVEEAADLIAYAVTARPRAVAPWWAVRVQAWSAVHRDRVQRFLERRNR